MENLRFFIRYRFVLLFFLLGIPFVSEADFINSVRADECVTILEIYIDQNRITAKFEIGEQDFPWFSDIISKEYFDGGYTEMDRESRLEYFFSNQFVLRNKGSILHGKNTVCEPRKRVPVSALYGVSNDSTLRNKNILYVEIEYPTVSRISQISITPPMIAGQETSPANIGFVVYHKGIPVNDLRILMQCEKLLLDWSDPWYSHFENRDISRHHSSSFMSFLYVEPYEVRHEILVRLKDLEGWINFGYDIDDQIAVSAQDSIKKRIADFLVLHNKIEIDSNFQAPIIDRVHFVEATLSGIQVVEIPKPLNYGSAIIGVILAYPHIGLPHEVVIHWDMFNDRIQHVPAMSIDPSGPWPYDLQPSDSLLRWTNFLKHYIPPTVTAQKVEEATIHVPIFSIGFVLIILILLFRNHWSLSGLSKWKKFFFVLCMLLAILSYRIGILANVPLVHKTSYTVPETKKLIYQLLSNTYRAFDFREESDVYDRLALCNDEALLQEIYVKMRASMAIENQGGLEAKVDEVVLNKVEPVAEPGVGQAYRCNWIVKGEVGHWGHKHKRINQYDAIIRIKPVGGVWKMVDIDIIKEVRLS